MAGLIPLTAYAPAETGMVGSISVPNVSITAPPRIRTMPTSQTRSPLSAERPVVSKSTTVKSTPSTGVAPAGTTPVAGAIWTDPRVTRC